MALAMTLRAGQDIYVGDSRVVVSAIKDAFNFRIKLENGTHLWLNEQEWSTVYPGVRMQAGIPRSSRSHSLVVLLVDAPGLPIVRGSLINKAKEVCHTCNGSGKLSVRENCPFCGGFGCRECVEGYVVVKSTCPDCNKGD